MAPLLLLHADGVTPPICCVGTPVYYLCMYVFYDSGDGWSLTLAFFFNVIFHVFFNAFLPFCLFAVFFLSPHFVCPVSTDAGLDKEISNKSQHQPRNRSNKHVQYIYIYVFGKSGALVCAGL